MAEAARVRRRAFCIDMNCDFRGRVYALPYFNYGRGDHIRALFKFAHGAPITKKRHLVAQGCDGNCYDEDGVPPPLRGAG